MSFTAINAKNQLQGQIIRIIDGPVVSEVEVQTGAGIVSAVVTSSSIRNLNLKVGREVVALFKATEVMLATRDGNAP
ncbi:MAG TPA: TOBE domain-containing protein [Nevskiaceae bacterium]|nr:TOBE domain-containing protein [Nevskiaceae bacterium]